jgi:hypothetical protein
MRNVFIPGFLVLLVLAMSSFLYQPEKSAEAAAVAPALVISEFGCNLLDGNGVFVFTDNTHAVITSSNNGNTNMRCQADTTPSASGRAVHFGQDTHPGLACGTPGGTTLNWKITVSASGKATMQCHVR